MPAIDTSIRDLIIDGIRTNLSNIKIANGYSRDISTDRILGIVDTPTAVRPPAIILIQGEEQVLNKIGDRYECIFEIMVGFVDSVRTQVPDKTATSFMAEIQDALPIEFDINTKIHPSGNATTMTVQLQEVGNTINVNAGTTSLVLGQVTYECQYRRNIHRPDRV
jgi:hypothetical protein